MDLIIRKSMELVDKINNCIKAYDDTGNEFASNMNYILCREKKKANKILDIAISGLIKYQQETEKNEKRAM